MGMIDSDSEAVQCIRFQAPHRNCRGHAVFGLVNDQAGEGRPSDERENIFSHCNNRWYDAAYTDPSAVDPYVYDDEITSGEAAWIKPSATLSVASPETVGRAG
ncbi:hypothetical protein ACWEDZ_39485 [Streptomyces sp. NPDC005047]